MSVKTVSREMLEAVARMQPDPQRDRQVQDHEFNGGRRFDLDTWIEEHEVPVKREAEWSQGGYRYVLKECPWNGHTDASAYIVRHSNGAIAAGCHHNSCQGYGWRELREHYEPGCYDRQPEAGVAGPAEPRSAELPDALPFPLAALPSALRTFVEEAAASIGCPPEFVAVPMLVTLGAAIGNSRVLQLKRGWTEGAALYAAVIADPGAKKTPAFKVATSPAWQRQAQLKREYDEALAEYRRAEADYSQAEEGELEEAPPQEPTLGRTVVEDATVESLVTRLEDNPRGLLCAKDELSGWVRALDQYKGGKGSDRQCYLSMWSGSPMVVDRKGRKEPITVPRPFVGLTGAIQPGVLLELKNDREDGLLDRFLHGYPEAMASRWTDDEISEEAVARYQQICDRLYGLRMAFDENGEPAPERLSFELEAKKIFIDEVNSLREEMERPGFPSRLKGPWSKLEAYLARLSLILALVRNAHEEEGSFMAAFEAVTERDVEAAAELVRYFKAHARRVYAKLHGERPEYLLAEALKIFLMEQGGIWEGQTSELYEILKARSVSGLPGGEGAFGKRLRQIVRQDPDLTLQEFWRGNVQVVTITLHTPGTPGGGGSTEQQTGGTGGRNAHQDDQPGGGSDERADGEEPGEPTSGPEDRRDEADEWGDGDPQTDGDDRDHLAEAENKLGPGWESKPAGALLRELGWSGSAMSVDDGLGDDRARTIDAERGPVANKICESVVTEDGYAAAATTLFEKPERLRKVGAYPTPFGWPTDAAEMQDHLKAAAAALRKRGILAWYWVKEGGGFEGFWIFLRAEESGPTREQMEERVWIRVAHLEGIEDHPAIVWFDDIG